MPLDSLDRQLLNLVQEDSSQSAEQLAETVPLSVSAIQRRLRRLRDSKVILRDAAIVDPRQVGRPTFFIVGLEVEREHSVLLADLRRWVAAEPQVQEAFYVTGKEDFVLIVTAPNIESYDALMSRLVAENPNVRKFTTNVVLSEFKRGLAIPVEI